MKPTLHLWSRRFRRGWCLVGMLVVMIAPGAVAATGTTTASADGMAQTEVGQQQLQRATERVGTQLDAILEEFRRNELGGDEVQLLSSIRSVLGQLSEDDMRRVVGLLQRARELAEPGPQRARLVEAFSTQKGVGLKLRQILLEYQRRQELAAVAARLEELAHRQNVAMYDTLALAASAAGRRRDWLSENQRISLQLLLSEQQSLSDEVTAVLERLRTWASEPGDEASARAGQALSGEEAQRLAWLAQAVMKDLSGGQLFSAAGREREARGRMRQVARGLMPPADELEALQSAVVQLEGLIGRQEELVTQTRQLPERSPALDPLRSKQMTLVDDTDVTRGEVLGLDPAAAEQVSVAVGRMQEARGVLDAPPAEARSRRFEAMAQQEVALARLEGARRLLRERMERLEKQREATADPVSNLEQVRADVAELLELQRTFNEAAAEAAPDAAKLRPMAPQQGDLSDRAGDTSQRAALDMPLAAELIAEASSMMRRSQKSLGEGSNAPGPQQAAIDALAKALAVLDQRLAELAAAQEELAKLEDLLRRLIAIIEEQKTLNAETARLARGVAGREPKETGQAQRGLAEATQGLVEEVPPSVPLAATYLTDANTQMTVAASSLSATRAEEARPPQDEALENLLRAKEELENRMAQLQQMLGLPGNEMSLEQLAELIKQAQGEVSEGLAADELKRLGQGLEQAGRRVQPATSGRLGRIPPMILDPLHSADQSLSEGSAAAAGGDQPGALSEAAKAQEALAAAAAAVDMAMAGMGQQPGSGQGQAGQGGQTGQGRGRGRTPGSRAGKGTGDAGNFFGAGGGDGPRRSTEGTGRFLGLPARERAALLQSQGERYPQEYAPMIEQYLKNLSDQVQGEGGSEGRGGGEGQGGGGGGPR